MKIRTFASGLTHLVFIALILLAAAKSVRTTDRAEAEDVQADRVAASGAAPNARTASMVAAPEPETSESAKPEGAAAVEPDAAEEKRPAEAPEPEAETQEAEPEPLTRNERLMRRLVDAYPERLAGYEDNAIIWHDGTRMPFDDGRDKSFKETLTDPDLEDQFYTAYPRGLRGVPPLENNDPGRVRYEPFFTKMYGDCKQNGSAVRGNLEEVVWLPENYGKTLRVTGVNGVAEALRQVSVALDELPGRFMKYLRPSAGTYHCRTIAGTARFSVHAYGAAVDINAKYGDYWRWRGTEPGEELVYRNRIPWEIVDIFEQHGFIWGGKWYHYDTLHFEYRPELLNEPPRAPAPLPKKRPPSPLRVQR